MSFKITEEYTDPTTVDLELLEEELKAGNPYAALVKSIIHSGGFNRGLLLSNSSAIEPLLPFIEKNVICAARRALLLDYGSEQDAPLKESINIVRPLFASLAKMAADGNYHARIVMASLDLSALLPRSDRKITNSYLVSAASPRAVDFQEEPLPGDPLAAYLLSMSLNAARQNLLSQRLIRKGSVSPADLFKEALRLRVVAAEGGVANAQYDVGRYYMYPEDKNPLAAGMDEAARLVLAEENFANASRQGHREAGHDLARLYIATGREEEAVPLLNELIEVDHEGAMFTLGQYHERREEFKEASLLFLKAGGRGHVPSLMKVADYAYNGRPGVMTSDVVAYQSCVRLLQNPAVKLSVDDRRILTPMRDELLGRAWLADKDGRLRRAQLKDDSFKTPFIFLSRNPAQALTTLAKEATKPETNLSVDLALELARRSAEGAEGVHYHAEARYWYAEAARLGHTLSMIEVIERCYEGREGDPADLPEALRACRNFLSQDRRKEGVPAARIRRVQEIQADLLSEETGRMPRLWVPDAGGSLRPLLADDDLSLAVSDPYNTIDRYVEFAMQNKPNKFSAVAALTAARLYDAAGEGDAAFDMYRQAVHHGNVDAGVELAERYAASGIEEDLEQAYFICAQLCTNAREDLSSDELRNRAETLRNSVLGEAWMLSAEEIVCRVRGGVYGDMEPPDQDAQLLFFPPDADGLQRLIEHEQTSVDAKVEVALRAWQGAGCPPNPDAAFWKLSSVLGILIVEEVPDTVPDDSPRREELVNEWRRLAASATVEEVEEGLAIHIPGAPDHVEATVLPSAGYEEFIGLLGPLPESEPAPQPAGPRIPARNFTRRDNKPFFE
ncbi:MAG TPA: hypothetical protein VHB73_04315 [Alphaproteobacteria bacterium]|nr:hypothetical protein [Alphaproteobacteria bacterium]